MANKRAAVKQQAALRVARRVAQILTARQNNGMDTKHIHHYLEITASDTEIMDLDVIGLLPSCDHCAMRNMSDFLRRYRKEDGARPFMHLPTFSKDARKSYQERHEPLPPSDVWVHVDGIAWLASTGHIPVADAIEMLDRIWARIKKHADGAQATVNAVFAVRQGLEDGQIFERPELLDGVAFQPPLIA